MPPAPISPKTREAIRKRRQQQARKPPVKKPAPKPTVRGSVIGGEGGMPRVPVKPTPKPNKPAPRKPAPKAPAAQPESITGALTPEQLDREAAAAVRTRFGGTEREIEGQQRVSTQMQANIGSWFDQYKADVELARQRTADFNTGVQTAQAQQAQQAQAVDMQQAASPEAQQAAAARRSTSDSFGAMLAAQAGTQNAYQADKGRIGSGEQQHQRLAESGRARTLTDELKALQGEKGDYEVGYRQQARESERKREMENAAFDLDTRKAQADEKLKAAAQKALDADRRADNRRADSNEKTRKMEADRRYRLDKEKNGAAAAKDAYQRRHKIGPYKPASSGKKGPSAADIRAERAHKEGVRKDSRTALNRLDKAKGAWDALEGASRETGRVHTEGKDKGQPVLTDKGLPETKPLTTADKKAELARQGYTPNEIHLMLTKKWGPQEVAMAHALGIRVPRSRLAYDPKIRAGSKNDPKPAGSAGGMGGK